MDHAPILRLRIGGGDQPALPLPPGAGPDGAIDGVRPSHPDGYDSDHPIAYSEVGRVGVPISHLEDMETVFEGINLAEVSTSMTINATASLLLAYYIAMAKKQGVDPKELRGTVQNDILKEYIAREPTSIRRLLQ